MRKCSRTWSSRQGHRVCCREGTKPQEEALHAMILIWFWKLEEKEGKLISPSAQSRAATTAGASTRHRNSRTILKYFCRKLDKLNQLKQRQNEWKEEMPSKCEGVSEGNAPRTGGWDTAVSTSTLWSWWVQYFCYFNSFLYNTVQFKTLGTSAYKHYMNVPPYTPQFLPIHSPITRAPMGADRALLFVCPSARCIYLLVCFLF